MAQFHLEIAGQVAQVTTLFESTPHHFARYLTHREPDFSITVTREDLAFEQADADEEAAEEGFRQRNFPEPFLERAAIQRSFAEHLLERSTILLHGSTLALDGRGYLFTARSGTGKSTHTRLWREMLGNRAIMVNDDKPFLQITGENVVAWGNPWMGKHRLGSNTQAPLKAICILERGETNEICRIQPKEAVHMLLQQSSRPQDPRKLPKYLDLMDRLSQRVAFYRLRCNMDPEAAQIAFDAMSR